ncbi:MAG: bacteriohemerythrin [Candidatus Thorarchaeota archaeon]
MRKITWDESLAVHIDLIDEQHKALIARIDDMAQAVESRQSEEKILKTLSFMKDYTDFHFSTEEKHMKKTDYPYINEHLGQHEDKKT